MSDPILPAGGSPFVIEPQRADHDRCTFNSGVEALDRYFASQATQDIRGRISACFVAGERGKATIIGPYTIAASSLPLMNIAAATAKKLPRYPLVPAVRIGRLAFGTRHRGQGIGAGLLVDGIARALHAEIAAFAIVVDAKDAAAVDFYKHHGFVAFASPAVTLYFLVAEAARRLGKS
jgi:GNAT superfamily N-acetyltransferase